MDALRHGMVELSPRIGESEYCSGQHYARVMDDPISRMRESAVKRILPHTPMEVQMRVQPTVPDLSSD
jgi:hypothetical protein